MFIVKTLRRNGEYSDSICLAAFATLNEAAVMVHTPTYSVILLPLKFTGNSDDIVQYHLGYNGRNHFYSIRDIFDQTLTPPEIRMHLDGGKLSRLVHDSEN